MMEADCTVLLYVPNIVGYCRLLLLLVGCLVYSFNVPAFIACYIMSAVLDFFDGSIARRLNQTSKFGAWLDVVTDITGRGILWSLISPFGCLITAFEWITFIANQKKGADWKSSFDNHEPRIVQAIMAKNFRTPLGTWTIAGLHVLPIYLFIYYSGVVDPSIFHPYLLTTAVSMLIAGRVLCFIAEIWCVVRHVDYLISSK